jgi:hypothetical protein
MAGTPLTLVQANCRAALRLFKDRGAILRADSVLKFNIVQGCISGIREADRASVKPLLDNFNATQIATLFSFPLFIGWPAPNANLTAIRAELTTLYTAARDLMNAVENPVIINAQGETEDADVDVTSLHAPIDALLAAIAPLE